VHRDFLITLYFIHKVFTCLHTYLSFPDIAHVQDVRVKLETPFILKRFVPMSNAVLEEQLDLSQFQVVISDAMDMCVRFQTAVLRVSGCTVSVSSSVLVKCRSDWLQAGRSRDRIPMEVRFFARPDQP
jgi:hypothetical protein